MKKPLKAKVPHLKSDREAEAFLAQDLSELDFTQCKPVLLEFEKKTGQINLRVPELLLQRVKERARQRGIPYTRWIRETLEQALASPK